MTEQEKAIWLILTIEVNPDTNPDTVKLSPQTRKQLYEAVGVKIDPSVLEYWQRLERMGKRPPTVLLGDPFGGGLVENEATRGNEEPIR